MKEQGGPGNSKIATARNFTKLIWYMLKKHAPYQLSKITDTEIQKGNRRYDGGSWEGVMNRDRYKQKSKLVESAVSH
jgi:hypothetical protein